MMSTIVFLDFDGVLIRYGAPKLWDAGAVAALNRVCRETAALIVVCSSWRLTRPLEKIRRTLASTGVTASVVAATPDHRNRAIEIGKCIEAQASSAHVIIDDDRENELGSLSHILVRPTHAVLNEADADRAIDILQRTP